MDPFILVSSVDGDSLVLNTDDIILIRNGVVYMNAEWEGGRDIVIPTNLSSQEIFSLIREAQAILD
tara:strand:+ start:1287 stop:1484 length:198 start_codon:yes stop_codon:yes gene_type:complete